MSDMTSEYRDAFVGLTVVGHRIDDEGFPVLHTTTRKGERFDIIVSSEPEGNGPGFLFLAKGDAK